MIELLSIQNLTALLSLTAMELVLGIDNIIFISILVSKLPQETRLKARALGILLALVLRILLLFSLTWIMKLNQVLFTVFNQDFTGTSLILICGGLFLVAKGTIEIQQKMSEIESTVTTKFAKGFGRSVLQIIVIDLIFSIDSVVTAVGMAQLLSVMILAVILSILVMFAMSGAISGFVDRNPTIKMLALSFLILIGVSLIIEGTGGHVAKGYIYFSMAFALVVEIFNLKVRLNQTPKK